MTFKGAVGGPGAQSACALAYNVRFGEPERQYGEKLRTATALVREWTLRCRIPLRTLTEQTV